MRFPEAWALAVGASFARRILTPPPKTTFVWQGSRYHPRPFSMTTRFILSLLAVSITAFAADKAPPKDDAPSKEEIARFLRNKKIVSEFKPQSGEIKLLDGQAKIVLTEDFRYLNPADARKLLVDIYHNPPEAGSTLGIIIPKDADLLEGDSWAAVLEWSGDGYVKDDDFAKIDFADMLNKLKEQSREENKERVSGGYSKLLLAGWAQQPHYDRTTHKLYWAKAYDVDGPVQQLNYDIRVLGRAGCLEISIIALMPQLVDIEKQAPEILKMVEFTEGNRYSDYKSGDKVAAYGIAGLIAGGVLMKAGVFKGLALLLVKGWKLVLVAVVGIGAMIKRIVSGKQRAS